MLYNYFGLNLDSPENKGKEKGLFSCLILQSKAILKLKQYSKIACYFQY